MIIDFHTHIAPLQVRTNRQNYAHADDGFAAIYSDPKAKLVTVEELIAGMDKDSVDISVVLNYGWSTQSLCVEINDYILESIARYPRRLVGFCSVVPTEGEKALRELERCVKGGAKGIGELRLDTQLPSNSWLELIGPIVEFAVKNNIIMLVHSSEPVGHQYPGKGKSTPDLLYTLTAAFPDLKLVCAHWGGGLPFYALMPEVRTALKNVYFDTAASPFIYTPQIYGQVAQLAGADKILFGSDYPLISPKRYFREIDSLELPAITRRKILGGNAQNLLGIADK
ncbi:MAG: amidohydrolase family protein [Dehalococcoidales bacterium]|nr:amidohydrolase family protein [Dehalococcoidales bacterium]